MCSVRFEMCTFSTARKTGAARLKAGEDVGQLQVEGEAALLDGQLKQLKPGVKNLFLVIILAWAYLNFVVSIADLLAGVNAEHVGHDLLPLLQLLQLPGHQDTAEVEEDVTLWEHLHTVLVHLQSTQLV